MMECAGNCRVDDPSVRHMSEFHRLKILQPPHVFGLTCRTEACMALPITRSSKAREPDAAPVCSPVMDGAFTDRSENEPELDKNQKNPNVKSRIALQ
jgi:hypothetical protein